MLEEEDIVRIMAEMAKKEGQANLAKRLKFSHSMINMVINGQRGVSDSLARSLGFKKIVRYIKGISK